MRVESTKCLYHLCNKERRTTHLGLSKYCSPSCKNKHHIKLRRARIKQRAIDYLGGKCQRCDYDKCPAVLEFHHRDESDKEFTISAKGNTLAWDTILKELAKCDLLCANCHRELHYELDQLAGSEGFEPSGAP